MKMMSFTNASLAVTVCGFLLIAVSAPEARAALIYENIGGAALLYDTSTGATWTRNADISSETFTYQSANAWAAGLTLAGLIWELPTVAEFTSLFTELDPYGAPGVQINKYGANVLFGAGPNDSALNVQTTYWTNTDQVDFNFFYGYGGSNPDVDLYAAWAIETPEPSSFPLLVASLIASAFFRAGRLPEFSRATR
jgi:hypothetical protein